MKTKSFAKDGGEGTKGDHSTPPNENKEMKMYTHVQVVYRQGLVKAFVAPHGEMLMEDFMKVVRAEGKVKTVRFLPDIDQAAADVLVKSGSAVKVEVRRG